MNGNASELKPTQVRVAELYLRGMSMAKVGLMMRMKVSQIHQMLRQAGIKLRGRYEPRPFPGELLRIAPERMAELYREGASIEKVAAQAGVSSTRAVKILRTLGVTIRPRPGKRAALLPPKIMARRYRAGLSAVSIAEEAGISVDDLRQILISSGEALRPPLGNVHGSLEGQRFSPEMIVKLYQEGESVQWLAATLSVSREMIRTLLLKHEVKLRGRGGQPSPAPDELVSDPGAVSRLYQAGHSVKEIAASIGSTAWKVRTVLLKLGTKLRSSAGKRGDDFTPPPVSGKKIAELYAAGAGLERVAGKSGISMSKVHRILREQKVRMRGTREAMLQPPDRRKISDEEVARRYQTGETLQGVALAADTTVAVIRRILAQMGVALRPKMAQLHLPEEGIAPLYREGTSLHKIAALAGCSTDVIRRILKREKVPIRDRDAAVELRAAKPQISAEEMQTRYEAGSSLSQIAEVARIDLGRVGAILRRRGVKLRGRGATPLPDTKGVQIPPEKMVELYLAGSTLLQIAALSGSNRRRIVNILKRHAVQIRNRR